MSAIAGRLETLDDVKIAVRDLDRVLQRLADALMPLMNAPAGTLVFLVKNDDGTYGIREVVAGGTLTATDDAVLSTLTISD